MKTLYLRKRSRNSLKARYGFVLRLSLISSLAIIITLFLIIPERTIHKSEIPLKNIHLESLTIPPAIQDRSTIIPNRPSVPVPMDKEDIVQEMNLEQFEYEKFVPLEVPPPPITETYDTNSAPVTAPEPIGGYDRLNKMIQYPPIARAARIEGSVFIEVSINEDGEVVETKILEGTPRTGFAEEALKVISNLKFKPAMRLDEPIASRDSIRVHFRLK
jgi:protein TonB